MSRERVKRPLLPDIAVALLALVLLQLAVWGAAQLFSAMSDNPEDNRRACHSHGGTPVNC